MSVAVSTTCGAVGCPRAGVTRISSSSVSWYSHSSCATMLSSKGTSCSFGPVQAHKPARPQSIPSLCEKMIAARDAQMLTHRHTFDVYREGASLDCGVGCLLALLHCDLNLSDAECIKQQACNQ